MVSISLVVVKRQKDVFAADLARRVFDEHHGHPLNARQAASLVEVYPQIGYIKKYMSHVRIPKLIKRV